MKNKIGDNENVGRHCQEAVDSTQKDYIKLSEPKTDVCEFFQKLPFAKVAFEIERNRNIQTEITKLNTTRKIACFKSI